MGARSHGHDHTFRPGQTVIAAPAFDRPTSLGPQGTAGFMAIFPPPKEWLLPPKPKLLHVLSQVLTIRIGFNRRACFLPSNPPHKSFLWLFHPSDFEQRVPPWPQSWNDPLDQHTMRLAATVPHERFNTYAAMLARWKYICRLRCLKFWTCHTAHGTSQKPLWGPKTPTRAAGTEA